MLSQHETDKPLILRRKSEFRMVDMALADEVDDNHPLVTQFRAATNELDWGEGKLAVILRGEERHLVRGALIMYLADPPETAQDEWLQGQAAQILGVNLGVTAATGMISEVYDWGPLDAA